MVVSHQSFWSIKLAILVDWVSCLSGLTVQFTACVRVYKCRSLCLVKTDFLNVPPPPRPSFTSTAQTNHFDQQSYPMQMEAGVELEKRLERLDCMMCTTFDAIRQLSHQVYSVDTKLADLVAQSTVASLSAAHQQGLLSSQLGHGDLEQAIGPNHSKRSSTTWSTTKSYSSFFNATCGNDR